MKVDMLPASSSTPATTLDLNLNEEKENELKRKNAKISSYYENLRTNVFSLLGIVLFFKNLQHPYFDFYAIIVEISLFQLTNFIAY